MEDYFMEEDDDYRELFITQTPTSNNVVSLEDNEEFRSVKDDKYLDISDAEVEVTDHMARWARRSFFVRNMINLPILDKL